MLYDELPIAQKAAMMRVCIKNGITNPDDIRTAYNNYVEGRNIFDGLSESYHRASAFGQFLANGGHIYSGEDEPTGQMQKKVVYTSPYYPGKKFATQRKVRQANWDYKHLEEKKRRDAALRQQRVAAMEEAMRKRQSDYLTASNDNTWVESRDPMVRATRPKNPHLAERAIQGAKAHAAWAKEHPVIDAVGMGLGALPFAVAAAPAVTVAGDAIAGSAVGQGITALLTNPYFDAAMTSLGGAHAAQSIANGEADWMTALELAPMVRPAKAVYNAGKTFVGPAAEWANEGLGRINQFMASPYTGKWTQFGGSEYRFKPGYLGMNGTPVESRAVSPWIKELPIEEDRYYRQVRPDALESYRANGVVSQFNQYGSNPTEFDVPMFSKGHPTPHRESINSLGDIWVVSKPGAKLEWESVNQGAAMSPKFGGEFNKAPISEFDFYQYDPTRGYFKLDAELGNAPFSKNPHVDYLNGLSEQQQIEYLTQNGLNDQWLWTLKNKPDHLESALRGAPVPTDEGLVVSALPDYSGGLKTDFDLFRRFTDRGKLKETMRSVETPKKNLDVTTTFKVDSDKRFMMFEPGKFINHDLGAMSVEEVVNTFGPEAEYYKKLYDVAKAHNFEGKYAQIGKDAEYNILNRFAINKADPDVAKGISEARGIYDIPEYRARFNRWGTLGDTFVDDALARIDDVKLQGRSKSLPVKGQHGVHGGAYTSPDATTIGITNSESSSWITDMIRHETNHVGHGLKRQPDWMRYHNEKIRPVVKEGKTTDTALDKYYDEMDEIVERSKTAVEYANKIRKERETLDQALTRLADMTEADIYNAEIPADVRQSIARYTKDSMLNFWKNFVGGYAAPVAIGAGTVYGASQSQKKYGGWLKPLTL